MKINARFVLLGIGFLMALVGMLSCTSTNEDVSSSGAVATMDQTATAASVIIEAALSTTPLPLTRVSNIGSSAPDTDATKTVEVLNVATAVAATLTAQPIATPTLDLAVTETMEAERMATMIAATLTAQPTPTLDQAVTQTRLAHFLETSVAATLTAQPQPIATDTPAASRQVVAYRTNEQALQGLDSLWNLTTFRDLYAPGVQTYNVSITPNQDWRWSFAWCAINSTTLGEILQPLTVTLLVDEHVLSNSDILQHQAVSNNGDQCFYWSTVLTNWQLGTIVKLEIRYSLTSEIDDGRQNYAAGQYQQVMFVNVR